MLTNTIGPISLNDWNTMRLLRGSIEFYRNSRDSRYTRALEKETELYRGYLSKYGVGQCLENSCAA